MTYSLPLGPQPNILKTILYTLWMTAWYVMLLSLIVSMDSSLMLVLMMELLSWVFMLMLEISLIFKYLLIQTIFMLCIISSIMTHLMWAVPLLALKLGLPPFHSWLVSLMPSMKLKQFIFMMSGHKVLPLLVMGQMILIVSVKLGIALAVLSGMWMILQSALYLVISFSSFLHTNLTVISQLLGTWFLVSYWTVYMILFILILSSLYELNVPNYQQSLSFSWTLLILSGMPPLVMFWFKLTLFHWLLMVSSQLSFMMLVVSFAAIMVYVRLYYSSCMFHPPHQPMSHNQLIFMSIMGLGIMVM